ncbi:MAG: hypothetical protein KC421_06420, partial [Anaerolineales bacterium]|nr:hypothetical protein [Anaerolineales bacterium]
ETAVLGVKTNIPFLLAILQESAFVAGQTSTNYLQTHMANWSPDSVALDEDDWLVTAVFELLQGRGGQMGRETAVQPDHLNRPDPWHDGSTWRNVKLT